MDECLENIKTCNAECCRWVGFAVNMLSIKQAEYYRARGCKLFRGVVLVPSNCPHLTPENKCDIHETKPRQCKEFVGQSGYFVPTKCVYKK